MSPPIDSQTVTSETAKSDINVSPTFNYSSDNFKFNLSNEAARFNYNKSDTFANRSRPRLVKVRRRQKMKSENLDLGLSGFTDASKLVGNSENVTSVCSKDSESNGLGFGLNLGDSVFSLGIGSNENRSKLNVQSENGSFVVGTSKSGLASKASGEAKVDGKLVGNSENGTSVCSKEDSGSDGLGFGLNLGDSVFSFGMEKGNVQSENGTFVVGSSKTETGSKGVGLNLSKEEPYLESEIWARNFVESLRMRRKESESMKESTRDVDQQKVEEAPKGSSLMEWYEQHIKTGSSVWGWCADDICEDCTNFVFGASKNSCMKENVDQQKQDSDTNKGKDFDMDKVKVEYKDVPPQKESECNDHETQKSSWECYVDEIGKCNNLSFVFGASYLDQQKQDSDKKKGKDKSGKDARNAASDMMGKVKVDIPGDSEKVFHPCLNVSSNSNIRNDENLVNSVFRSDNNVSKSGTDLENKPNSKSGDGSIDSNCDDSKEHIQYRLSEEMEKLNIDRSKAKAKADEAQIFTSKLSSTASDVFHFESSVTENHQKSKTPDITHSSRSNTESNGTSSFLSSIGKDGTSTDKGDTKVYSCTSTLEGLNSSNADYSTPNLKFSLPNLDVFSLGVDKKTDKATYKCRNRKKLNPNGKLRKKTLVHDLFGQDHPSEEGSLQHNQNSPCGSPMEFSPYNQIPISSEAPVETELKREEFTANPKDNLEQCENPHVEENISNLSSALHEQDGLSAIRRQYKKKYKMKVGLSHTVQGSNSTKIDNKQGSARPANHVASASPSNQTIDNKKGSVRPANHEVTASPAIHDECEEWRTRGNQAYQAGKLSKAEEFYSNGINSVQHAITLEHSIQPLVLCLSNRAATRMALGRMREAIDDCRSAAALDPSFLKVTLRAGNCYLIIGEVEDAASCYNKCLESGAGVCLDRKFTIDAADGLLKAKRVAEYMSQSAKLLQQGTHDAARIALENIAEALSISRYSDELLEMKGEAMCILRMYEEVIELCEQNLRIAKKNFPGDWSDDSSCKKSNMSFWRRELQAKCHYRLGRLDLALNMLEQLEKIPCGSTSGKKTRETSIALAATIRELLRLKESGNDAFRSGKYLEAVEHYTAAISKSIDSRPFLAICFCNRAAAYQSVGQIIDAIADCSLAIVLDENYQKAISRRATLHEMIRDYKQATYDLERLISLLESESQTKPKKQYDDQSKSSGGAVRDLRKARRQVSLIEEKAKKEIPLDLYLILGIKASDTESEIKKAYRKAALKHHPDKAGQVLVRSDVGDDGALWKEVCEKTHQDADRLFKIIGEAYAVLSDRSKRSKYDDEEETRNVTNNRNSDCGNPSTSYSNPYASRRQASTGSSTSTDRNNSSRRSYWWN